MAVVFSCIKTFISTFELYFLIVLFAAWEINDTEFSPVSFKDFQLNSHLSTLANIHKIYHTLNKLVSQFF